MRRIRNLFRRRKLDGELTREINSHFEERVDELIEGGMDREQAVFEAKRRFGNATLLLEQGREVWRFPVFENLMRDLRVGMRSLAKAPLFTSTAIAILALGIGANCAMFSLIDAVLLRPLPFADAGRIVAVWERPPHEDKQNSVSPLNFLDWRDRTRSFDALAAAAVVSDELERQGGATRAGRSFGDGRFFSSAWRDTDAGANVHRE